MKNAFVVIILIGLVLGGYIYKTNGKGKCLPSCIQPHTVRIYQFMEKPLPHISSQKTKSSFQNKRDSSSSQGTASPSPTRENDSNTKTITYRNSEDLLRQLKQVRTGQSIYIQPASSAPVSTGIKCSDTAAKAAYMKREQAVLDQINAELRRIARQ